MYLSTFHLIEIHGGLWPKCCDLCTSSNTLDLLITRAEGRPMEWTVDRPDVISDHALVVCRFPSQSFAAWNVEWTIRPWKKEDRSAMRDALMSTALCPEVETSGGWGWALRSLYDDTLRQIADNLAPASTSTRRIRRPSPWFDSDCRSERRRTRLLERRYRKSKSDGDRTAWVVQMQTNLRSETRGDLLIPRTRTKLGERSFRLSTLSVWNSLPFSLKHYAKSRRHFRKELKTYLLRKAYASTFEKYWRVNSLTYLLSWSCHILKNSQFNSPALHVG